MKMMFVLLIIIGTINIFSQGKWQKLNGPEGGTISAIITKGDTIITGTGLNKAIIFFSTNGGSKWTKANFKTSYPGDQSRINDFIISSDGGIIATDAFNGLYKSMDLIHWSNIYYNHNDFFWSLGKEVDGSIYAGTESGHIFKSSNNNLTWNFMSSVSAGRITSFLLTKDSTLYAGTYMMLLKKKFNTEKWDSINFQGQNELNLFADESNNIFASNTNYLFLSSNNGLTWEMQDTNHFFYYNFVYHMIYNKRIFAGCADVTGWLGNSWGIAVSDDRGLTWKWKNNGLPPKISTAYCFSKSSNNTYVGTNAAGLFKSSDFGESWFPVNNGIWAANTIDVTFDKNSNLYAACWSDGFFRSSDKGLNWKLINNGLTNVYCYSIIADSNGNLISGTDQGIFRSTDKGENWSLTNPAGNNFAYSLYRDKYNRIYAINYGDGIYRTTDLGTSWQRIDDGFGSLYAFGFVIDQNDNIYAGTRGGNIYKSTNDGLSWAELRNTNSIYNSVIANIAIAPNGNIFATNIEEGVLRSTDSGQSWNVINNGLGSLKVSALGINSKGQLFVSTLDDLFFYSSDNGESWQNIVSNLDKTTVNDIIFDKNDTIYLATDESVWRSNPDSSVSVIDRSPVILQYALSQNFPNPFNPNTTINYSIKDEGMLKIEIYDILGRKVESLINEENLLEIIQ